MSINSLEQFEKPRACGMIVGKALRAIAAEVRAGVTTAELCEIGSRLLAALGARSSPPIVYGFPGDVCISLNDEVVHGIPGDRILVGYARSGTYPAECSFRSAWQRHSRAPAPRSSVVSPSCKGFRLL